MFSPAVRTEAKIKIAISGPSGSGKTKGALRIAVGLGAKKIAVIDSENRSSALYSKEFKFDIAPITPPYTTEKYLAAIGYAAENNYDCIIVDSGSHAWAGEGGILEQKSALDEKGGNSYTNWNKPSQKQNKFMSAIQNTNVNMIVTLRSKQDYVLTENAKGKLAPKKVGMAPIQKDGTEYEFTSVFNIDMNHDAEASKDRTEIFDGTTFQITEETGRLIRAWLDGADVKAKPAAPIADIPNDQLEELRGEVASLCNQITDQDQATKALEWTIKAKTITGLEKFKVKLEAIIEQQGS